MATAEHPPTIAVDAMGSDQGPAEVLQGVAAFIREAEDHELSSCHFCVIGRGPDLEEGLDQAGLRDHPRLTVVHAEEVIGMDEKPLQSIKRKRDSSMVRALSMVREGNADALLSCGNTGSLMAGGTLMVRPLEGVDRPALATIIPTRSSRFILLDAGANPEPTALQMSQNAILGSNYARVVLGRDKPSVGLLTIGTEEGKGSTRVQEAHQRLKEIDGIIDYHGLIEGFQVFEDPIDVVVCDGFTGNVVLKVCESLFKMLVGYLKDELSATWIRRAGAYLSMGAFKEIRQELDPAQYGGAPLLGLRAPILKAHGSSDRNSIAGALGVAATALRADMTERMRAEIADGLKRTSEGNTVGEKELARS
jgi:glycerol-3-phosphate acyltransferase PlsX